MNKNEEEKRQKNRIIEKKGKRRETNGKEWRCVKILIIIISFFYSYCLKIKDACMHAYIDARYNKYRQKADKQIEEGRVQVWLFVDVFQDNECGKQFSRSSSYSLLFFMLLYTISLLLRHTSQTTLLCMISVNISSLYICVCVCLWQTSNNTEKPSNCIDNRRRKILDLYIYALSH